MMLVAALQRLPGVNRTAEIHSAGGFPFRQAGRNDIGLSVELTN